MGGYDIMYSDMLEDSTWSEPVNMGHPLNTTSDDIHYVESADGRRAFYSGIRKNQGKGKSDIYRIDMVDPKESALTLLTGKIEVVSLDGLPLEMVIYVVNLTSGEETVYNPNSESGEYSIVLPAGSKYSVSYERGEIIIASATFDERKRKTYRHVTKTIFDKGKIETIDSEKPMEKEAPPGIKEDTIQPSLMEHYFGKITDQDSSTTDSSDSNHSQHLGKTIVLDDLFFAPGETHLLEKSFPALDKLYALMNEMPNMTIEISGHTDSKGERDFNMILSAKRAQAVVDEIVKKGIKESRMIAKGYGETAPVADNLDKEGKEDAEGMAKNRRVELKVLDLGN